VTIQQPLIQPLYNGRSAMQILQLFTEQPDTSPYDIVKNYWLGQHKGTDFHGLVAGVRSTMGSFPIRHWPRRRWR